MTVADPSPARPSPAAERAPQPTSPFRGWYDPDSVAFEADLPAETGGEPAASAEGMSGPDRELVGAGVSGRR